MIILGNKVNDYYICNNLKIKSIKKEGICSKAQSACSVMAFYISGSSGTGYSKLGSFELEKAYENRK